MSNAPNRPVVNLGLAGCGLAAERLYIPALRTLTEVRVVAVTDPIPSRIDSIQAHIPDCIRYESFDDLLASGVCDAVAVTAPPQFHVALAKMSLMAPVPVLVEKPLSLDLNGVAELAALQSKSAWIQMGFNRRYWQPVIRLRHALANTLVRNGAVNVTLRMVTNATDWVPVAGKQDPLDDLMTHQIDMVRFVSRDDVVKIRAMRPSSNIVTAELQLKGGGRATCHAEYGDNSEESIAMQDGDHAYRIHLGSEHIAPVSGIRRRLLDIGAAAIRRVSRNRSSLHMSYSSQLRSLANTIRIGHAPTPDLHDGIAVLQTTLAARRSIESSQWETVNHAF